MDQRRADPVGQQLPPQPGRPAYCWFLAWDVGGAKYLTAEQEQLGILRSNLRICESVFAWIESTRTPFTFVGTQMAGYANAYGITKQVGEYWAGLLPGGLVARLWNCYGPEPVTRKSYLLPDLVHQGVTRGRIRLMTSGAEQRQFLHADDCADGLIQQRECGQPVADLTSGQWVTVASVAAAVARELECPLTLGERPGYDTLVEPVHRLAGWQPRIGLPEGIRAVVRVMREQGWV